MALLTNTNRRRNIVVPRNIVDDLRNVVRMGAWQINFQAPESSVTRNGFSSNSRRFTDSRNYFHWLFSDCRKSPRWRLFASGSHSLRFLPIVLPADSRKSAQTENVVCIWWQVPDNRSPTRKQTGNDLTEHFVVFPSVCERSGRSLPQDSRSKSRMWNRTLLGLRRQTGSRPSASCRSSVIP